MTATKLRRATFVFALSAYLGMGLPPILTAQGSGKPVSPAVQVAKNPASKNVGDAAKKAPGKPAAPTEITASETSYDFNKGLALFIGNVHVVDATMDMRADEMQIYRNNKTGQFIKIIALGKKNKVVFTTAEGKAVGKTATYDLVKGELVMEGQLRLDSPGARFIDPTQITYHRIPAKKKGDPPGGLFHAQGGRVILTNTKGQTFKSLLSIDNNQKSKKDSAKDKNTAKNAVTPEKKQP